MELMDKNGASTVNMEFSINIFLGDEGILYFTEDYLVSLYVQNRKNRNAETPKSQDLYYFKRKEIRDQ